jgi:hypothetical protein
LKTRVFLPFLAMAGLILLVGLACSTSSAAPTQIAPTQAPPVQPTLPPTIQVQPTDIPIQATTESPAFFTENFDGLIPDWSYFVKHGDESKLSLQTDKGYLVFNLTGEDLYAYLLYDPYTYTDVRIDARAENRGFNSNEVSLVCRYDPNYGWYEFSIGNDGLYAIYAFDATTQEYETLFDGGSTSIHSGKDVNEYTVICQGNTLSLYINGVETRTITEKRYSFRDGQVGISTSSFNVIPIIVEWDWVTISQP